MKTFARKREKKTDLLLDAFVMFPPNKENPLCKAPSPQLSCEPTQWSIKVPVGRYNVKVTIGDPENKAGYNM